MKNKFKLTVRFAEGGYKPFFVDDYKIDNFGFVVFKFQGKIKKFHSSNVDIESYESDVGDSL